MARETPLRACLDIAGDPFEGGRIVNVVDWLKAEGADLALTAAVMTAMVDGRPYEDIRNAWSLTPLEASR